MMAKVLLKMEEMPTDAQIKVVLSKAVESLQAQYESLIRCCAFQMAAQLTSQVKLA